MDCKDCLDRLHPFLDRELSPEEVAKVKDHLDACGGCESSLVAEHLFIERVRVSATTDIAPAEVRERLILRIRSGVRRGS